MEKRGIKGRRGGEERIEGEEEARNRYRRSVEI